ncbi:MAG TPA: transglycosylase domain-containing protein, partial [Pseudomonadales bacterium]|nr:transglycosylase domain-containing protein [Pseudomonadales bacterium]
MLGALLSLATITAVISGFTLYLGPQIPKIDSVLDLKLQTPLKIFSRDGLLIGEFGEMRREPLPYSALPPLYIKAVLAAEDDRFFTHSGVDPTGLARAAAELAKTGHIRSGGSTITMQLARNFFLSSEKSFIRKFNEILLSIQLERTLKKEKIFELYVNKIYLGHKAYGAQSAAYVYYGKTLDQLSLAQWAMLAGLPKAPSKYNPLVNPERALIRRNWILGRMLSLGSIDKKTYDQALIEPETASYHGLKTDVDSPYIAEMARQFAVEKLGSDAYNNGYIVRTTIDSHLQLSAQQAIWNGAVEYDQR